MNPKPEPPCPCLVCESTRVRRFLTRRGQTYFRCESCLSTWLDPSMRLSPDDEYHRYLEHQNDPMEPGYRGFLARLADPLTEKLAPGARGLDYGCGPGLALAMMMEERGFPVAVYDPFFHPDSSVLNAAYDFITCSEVIEHFHHPAREFERLDRLLKPGGWLGLMTGFQTDDDRFEFWHYQRDPTHVVFYREHTLKCIAERHGWTCEIPCNDVALMGRKK